jgi:hypothetical protein
MAAAIAGRAMPGFDLIAMAQYVFDRSFDDQDITGTYAFTFTSGPTLNMELEKGKVKSCVAMIDGVDQVSGVKYMSSRMRTFDAISGYLKMRAMHEKTITDPRLLMGEMIKDYKIYDVTYIEQMIHSMPFTDMEKIKPSFANFDIEDDIRSFGVDLIKGDFYARIGDDERIKYLCTYGNGHQALFNMILGGAI